MNRGRGDQRLVHQPEDDGATGSLWRLVVVRRNLRFGIPWIPSVRIKLAIRCRPQACPLSKSSARTRGTPIGSHTLRLDGADLTEQSSIFLTSSTFRPLSPGIVPTCRHPQDSAHHPNGIGLAVTRYALKPCFNSLAKYAAASHRKSRSRFTRPNSRFNWATSSSWA